MGLRGHDAAAISARGLSVAYGSRLAVDQASFTVPAGARCGFIGPNGAGKTTVIRSILGLFRPAVGSIEVFGRDVGRDRRAAARCIGAVLGASGLYDRLTGAENLRVAALQRGVAEGETAGLLARVGLEGQGRLLVGTYSTGMRQRLAIAKALIGRPRLLVLDEPTNGLDPDSLEAVLDLLRRLNGEGVTVFVSSHQLAELDDFVDHLVVMREGRVLQCGARAAAEAAEIRVEVACDRPLDLLDLLQRDPLAKDWRLALRGDRLEVAADVADGRRLAGQVARLAVGGGHDLFGLAIEGRTLADAYRQSPRGVHAA